MFQTKAVQKIKTHILCAVTFFFSENRAVCELIWGKRGRVRGVTDDNIIRRMRFVRWVPKATNTRSEYVILIAFQLQQWSTNTPQIYLCTYIVSLLFELSGVFLTAEEREREREREREMGSFSRVIRLRLCLLLRSASADR